MVVVTDGFANGSDQDLSARTNWSKIYGGTNNFKVFSSTGNLGYGSSSADAQYVWNANTFTGDHYVQITIKTLPTGSTSSTLGFTVWSTTGGNYIDAYISDLDNTGAYSLTLNTNNGTFQTWGSQTGITAGTVIRVEIVGTTLSFKVNGEVTHTLSLATANHYGNYVGLYAGNATPSNAARFDDFEAGDLTGGVVCTPGLATLTLTPLVPTVTATAPITAVPGLATLSLTPLTPTVSTPRLCTPGVVALTTTPFVPTISTPRLCTPGVSALSLTPLTPTVSATANLVCTPGLVALSLTPLVPSVVLPVLTTPGVASLALSAFAPTVTTPRLCVPGVASLSLTPLVPTVTVTSVALADVTAYCGNGFILLTCRGPGTVTWQYSLDGSTGWTSTGVTGVLATWTRSNNQTQPLYFRATNNGGSSFQEANLVGSSKLPVFATATKFKYQGWTYVPLQSDTTVVFCSQSHGSDSNDGSSANVPVKSPQYGLSLLPTGTGSSAHLLLCRGDVWNGSTDIPTNSGVMTARNIQGRSEDDPFTISAYGSGALPRVLGSGADATLWMREPLHFYMRSVELGVYNRAAGSAGNYCSLFFFADDPMRAGVTMHFENNNFVGGVGCAVQSNASTGVRMAKLTIRRNRTYDTYVNNPDSGGAPHCQGWFIDQIDSWTIEENFNDHCGWSTRTEDANGFATIFNHNWYLSAHSGPGVFRDNISCRASATGAQVRPGGTCVRNLFLSNPVNFWFANFAENAGDCSDNVALGTADISTVNHRGWGLSLNACHNTTVKRNIFAHATNGTDPWVLWAQGGDGTESEGLVTSLDSVLIENNIAYKWEAACLLAVYDTNHPPAGTPVFNVTFRNNDLQNYTSVDLITSDGTSYSAGFVSNGNRYKTSKSNPFYGPSGYISLSAWNTLVGDGTSSLTTASYPDPERDIASYMTSIGGTATEQAFIDGCKANQEGNWDVRYTAPPVIDYIRAGFGLPSLASIVCTPGLATLTLTTFPPSLLGPQTFVPGVAALTLTPYAPAARLPILVVPNPTTLTTALFAPTVLAPRLVVPPPATLTLTPFPPGVAGGAGLTCVPGAVLLQLTPLTPSIFSPLVVTPGTTQLTLTCHIPFPDVSGSSGPAEDPPHTRVPRNLERITNALIAVARAGVFHPVITDPNTGLATVDETQLVAPSKATCVETAATWRPAKSYRRELVQERQGWLFTLQLSFTQRVSTEEFEESLASTFIRLPPYSDENLLGVFLRPSHTSYIHPPEQSPNKGSIVAITFEASIRR